ncbi:MAG: outer membrane beta-barrel protein [Verrucomicrobia bacterium]|jgi:hypothetical protein|nr:outer membrane beta-barrel protein [Verrucomicrobiota bacterium]
MVKLKKQKNRSLLIGGATLVTALTLGIVAQAAESGDATRIDRLEEENNALRERLDALEGKSGSTSLGGGKESSLLKFVKETEFSGFVSGSYFYDGSKPADGSSNGYLWSSDHNEFNLNKIKLTLENAVERSGSDWDVGYHVAAILGEDAPIVNSGGAVQGLEDIRQAYVELNVPIGTGLNVRAGQLISLLNFESGDGGPANPNFSQGNQWFFTGNPPGAGLQVSYELSDQWGVDARVQNGLYQGVDDNNSGKTFMGALRFKPNDRTWIKLMGFAGPEGLGSSPGGNTDVLSGVQVLAGIQLEEEHNVQAATELTYMHWDEASVALAGDAGEAWSAGAWLWGDITDTFGLALRGDVVADQDGSFTSGLLGFPANPGQKIYSLTLTGNYLPHPKVKIQPEIRYESTDLAGGFDGADDRLIVGLGLAYLF